MSTFTTTIKTTPAKGNIPAKAVRKLASRIGGQLDGLRKAYPRATARTLGQWDADDAATALARAWASRNDDDVACIDTTYGGTLPNSYKYRADGDMIRIEARKDDNGDLAVTVTVERTAAPKRAHGRTAGGVHLLREGQTMGRSV